METRVLRLTRHRVRDGGPTLFFTIPACRRGRALHQFLRPHEVPEFDGEEAWFECERVGTRHVPIRQVQPSASHRAPGSR